MGRSKGFAAGVSAEYLQKVGIERPRRVRPDRRPPAPTGPAYPEGTVILEGVIPGEGLSVNDAYHTGTDGKRHATRALQAFKRDAGQALLTVKPLVTPRPQRMELILTFYGDWMQLNGQPRKRDVSNLVKAVEDVLAQHIGIDDRWFFALEVEKVHLPDDPKIDILIRTL